MSQEKSLQTADKSVKALFANEKVKAKFEEILGKKSAGFMASVLQIASLNLPKDIEPKNNRILAYYFILSFQRNVD